MMTTNKTGSSSDGIGQRLHETGDRFIELKQDVARRVGKRVDSLGAIMKEHPLAAVGVGLGIGYLIARIVHR
jgi:ElaB/YqjD/DUF883 family membrane-anchored ribosome-binding protein